MWTFQVHDGSLFHNGEFVSSGYSGAGQCRNRPECEYIKNAGPIPRGLWHIGEPYTDEHRGPMVMRLTPDPETNTFGRDGFLIHGDSKNHNASTGCLILGPLIRQAIASSDDYVLEVV